jgi:hypothetical protein
VTTEKDMVKVARLFPDDIDLAALGIDMEIRGLDRLLEYITGGRRPAPGSPQTGDTTSS